MRKSTGLVKKIVALILVVLMSINTFAAVVGDNDGAAFITKAEFDSMKNDFQSQLDRYNSSIDNKIDGAIASYLSGISMTRKRSVAPLVNNYYGMQWIPNWKLYGRYKHWSGRTTIDQNKTNVWFSPPCERRLIMRDKNIFLYDSLNSAYTNWINAMYIEGNGWGAGLVPSAGAYVNWDGYKQTPPVGVLTEVWDNDLLCYVLPDRNDFWENAFSMNYEIYVNTHTATLSPGPAYSFWNTELHPASPYLSVGSVTGNQLLKYTYWLTRGSVSGPTQTGESTITTDLANFPTLYASANSYDSASDDVGGWQTSNDAFGRAETSWGSFSLSDWLAAGVTYAQLLSNTITNQKSLLINGFFGKYNDQEYNILKWANYSKSGDACIDFSTADLYSSISGNITGFMSSNPMCRATNVTEGRITTNIPITIRCPLFPVEQIKTLTSGKFLYQKRPLKIGEGLPLLDNIDSKGYIQISFDYTINNAINSTSYTTTKDLSVSFKKGDYLTSDNNADYLYGYVGHVNPDATSASSYTLNDWTYPERSGNVKLTIPVEKDDTIWFRMYPKDESGGYYAKMNNLKIELITD